MLYCPFSFRFYAAGWNCYREARRWHWFVFAVPDEMYRLSFWVPFAAPVFFHHSLFHMHLLYCVRHCYVTRSAGICFGTSEKRKAMTRCIKTKKELQNKSTMHPQRVHKSSSKKQRTSKTRQTNQTPMNHVLCSPVLCKNGNARNNNRRNTAIQTVDKPCIITGEITFASAVPCGGVSTNDDPALCCGRH